MSGQSERILRWVVVALAIATGSGMGIEAAHLRARPFLGMSERGAVIAAVREGGPADRAGLASGDRLVAIAGRNVDSLPEPSGFLRDQPLGTPIPLVVERAGVRLRREILPDPLPPMEFAWTLALAAVACAILAIGAFVFVRRTTGEGAAFFGMCFALSILLFRPYCPPTPFGYSTAAMLVAFLSAALPGLLLSFFLLFPFRRSDAGRSRTRIGLVYLPALLLIPLLDGVPYHERLFGSVSPLVDQITATGTALYWIAALTLSIVFSVQAYRQSPLPTVRQKLRLTLAGVLLGLGPLLIVLILRLLWPNLGFPGDRLAPLALLFLAATFGYAVVHHGALDVAALVQRGLIYSVLMMAWVLLYFLVYFAFNHWAPDTTGLAERIGIVLALLFVLLISSPLRRVLQERVERWVYPDRFEIRRPLRETAVLLQGVTEVPEVEQAVMRVVQRTLGVEQAAIFRPLDPAKPTLFTRTRALNGSTHEVPSPIEMGHLLVDALFRFDGPTLRGDLESELPYGFLPRADLLALRALDTRVLVPLRSPQRRLGALLLGPRAFHEPYLPPDLELLEGIQAQAALAFENAFILEQHRDHKTLQKEIEVARSLQRSLLPQQLPTHANLEFAVAFHPSHEVGGDYYDCQVVTNGKSGPEFVLAIGDVSGKGVPAALLMANVQATFRAEAAAGRSPEQLLANINERLCAIQRPDRFVSLFCARLDPTTRHLRYANGGHLFPVLARAGGTVRRLERGGLLLGIQHVEYLADEVDLAPGDVLFLYTDGLVEREGSEVELTDLALESLMVRHRHLSAEDIIRRLLEEAQRIGPGFSDDTTLLAIKIL